MKKISKILIGVSWVVGSLILEIILSMGYFWVIWQETLTFSLPDLQVYRYANYNLINNNPIYSGYFFYFPSFFIISPITFLPDYIYFTISAVSMFLSIYLMVKTTNDPIFVCITSVITFIYVLTGNIDPIVLIMVNLSLYFLEQKQDYLSIIIFTLFAFKPQTILLYPLFWIKIEKPKWKRVLLFLGLMLLLNLWFIFYLNVNNLVASPISLQLIIIRVILFPPQYVLLAYWYYYQAIKIRKRDSKIKKLEQD